MILFGSYMFEFSTSKGMKIHASHDREVAVG